MTFKSFYNDPKFKSLKDIAIFCVLLLSFHFFYRYWAQDLHYYPFYHQVAPINSFLMKLLYDSSLWVLQHWTNYDVTTDPETRTFWLNGGSVFISSGCSGFKQFLQWIFLMLLFPGPWKHKLWFIPAGLVITQLINIMRIDILVIILDYYPQHWHFTHDYILRPFFYVVMFGLWVFWVEKITPQKK